MKSKPNVEPLIYLAVILLSLAALALVVSAKSQFNDTKLVYQGF